MGTKAFILAQNFQECAWIAKLAGFQSRSDWEEMGDFNTKGCRGNVVLSTAMHCWRSERGFQYAELIGEILHMRDLKVVHVPCPQEWGAIGFRLPEGWREPKTYPPRVILHPPVPKSSFWQWVRRAVAR